MASSNETDLPVKYKVRNGTLEGGRDFELNSTVYLSWKNAMDYNIEDFRIACNVDELGSFDDIVESRKMNEKWSTTLMQLKTKQNPKGAINVETIFNKKNFLNLKKEYESYQKIVSDNKPRSDIILGEFRNVKWCLYTNATVSKNMEEIPKRTIKDSYLDTSEKEGFVFKFIKHKKSVIYKNVKELEKGEEFLSKVIIFSGQKCGEALKNHIVKLIEKKYRKEDIDSTKLFIDIQKFCKSKMEKGYFITKSNIQQELFRLIINQIHRKCMDKGNDLEVGFSEESTKETQELVEGGGHRQVWYSSDGSSDLLRWKMKKTVEKMENVLYISSHYLKRFSEEIKCFIFLQKTNLIIEAERLESVSSEFEGMTSKVIVVPKTKPQKSIKSWDERRVEVKWQHLNKESQKSLLEKEITFQGETLKLGFLFRDNPDRLDLLRGKEILAIIGDNDEHLKLGKEFKGNDFYYVKRYLNLTRLNLSNLKGLYSLKNADGYVIINGGKYEEEIKQIHPQCDTESVKNIRIYGNLCFSIENMLSDEAKDQLNQLFENIHILTKQIGENKLFWARSYKTKVDSRYFLKEHVTVKEDDIEHIKDTLIIVEGEPGSGKTSLTTNLSKELKNKHPEKFLFFTHLASCQDFLNEHKITNLSDVGQFIRQNDISKTNEIYNFLETKDKAIVFLDGYDELESEECKEKIIRLIDILLYNNQIYKIIVTSRKNTRLNEHFPTYAIRQIEEDDQVKLLIENCKRLLGSEGNSEKIGLFCDKLKKLLNVENNNLLSLGVPLHVKILVESFEKELRSFVKGEKLSLPSSLNILQLYQKFIRAKMNILIREKYQGLLRYDKVTKEGIIKGIEEKCMKVALILMYKPYLRHFSPQVSEEEEKILFLKIIEGKFKCGIISHLENSKPVFIHLTMSEFFVAMFFYKNLKDNLKFINSKIILIEKKFTITNYNPVISLFLNLFLAKESNFLTSIILNDKDEAVKLFTSSVNDVDEGGRNFLQLCIYYGRKEIITSLWEKNKKIVMDKISSLLEKTKISFFILENYLCFIELILELEYEQVLLNWKDLDEETFEKFLRSCTRYDYLNVFNALSNAYMQKGGEMLSLILKSDIALPNIFKYSSVKLLKKLVTYHTCNYNALERCFISAIKFESEECLKILISTKKRLNHEKFYVNILKAAIETDNLSIGKKVLKFILENKKGSQISLIATEALTKSDLRKCNEDLCIDLIKRKALLNSSIISEFHDQNKLEVFQFLFLEYDWKSNYSLLLHIVPKAIQKGLFSIDKIPPKFIYMKEVQSEYTILHYACRGLHQKEVEKILYIHRENLRKGLNKNKEFVNWKDKNGDTPLHIASKRDHAPIIQVLLQNGADINVKNNSKETPLTYLRQRQNSLSYKTCLNMLEEHISVKNSSLAFNIY